MRIKALSFFLAMVAAASIGACSENLGSTGGCPLLCPEEKPPLIDEIIEPIVLDTFAIGFPPLGYETSLFLAHRADSLDARVITRYDSLPQTYRFDNSTDSAITRVDSAFIRVPRPVADTGIEFNGNVLIQAYDVTDAVNDTAVADLTAQMTAGNLIGEVAFGPGDSPDTLEILLDTARVRFRVLETRNLRIGLRMVSNESDMIRVISTNSGGGVQLRFYPNLDPAAQPVSVSPRSFSPADDPFVQGPLSDFNITVAGLPPGANVLRVGGRPANRVLLKFSIPSRIVDSAVVVRATLFLTQVPSNAPDAGTAVGVQLAPILSSAEVRSVHAQLEFSAFSSVDSVLAVPKDSGVVQLDMVRLVRAWRGQDTLKTPRLAGLFLSTEASRVSSFDFFSSEAAANLRPRLRLTYIKTVATGQP